MKTILVVDDNELIRKSVAAYLSDELKNSRVLTASNGSEGEQLVLSHSIDLILTDVVMPVMDGITFIRRISRRFPQIPVFVMSADRCASREEELSALGVSRFFEKPFPYEELIREAAGALYQPLLTASPNRSGHAGCALHA